MSILSSVLPTTGHYAIFGYDKPGKTALKPQFLDCLRESGDDYVEAAIERLRKRGATDFYFTLGAFVWPDGTPRSRAAHFAARFRAYGIDIDCHGKDGEYGSAREAGAAVLPLLAQNNIYPSRIVFTGRGLQLFWVFKSEISATQWVNFSRDIWSVLMHLGIKADPACQGDRARIWRLPGTINSVNGEMARVVQENEEYAFSTLKSRIDEYINDHGVVLAEPERASEHRNADEDGTVLECKMNNDRLRWLLDRIPSDFSTLKLADYGMPHRDGYSLWRNVIWAAKRTGLSEAWEIVNDWAEQASDAYDDLEEAVARTWDSDDEHKECSIGPGTLVRMAETFAPRGKRGGLKGFHFLDEREVALLGSAEDVIDQGNRRPEDDDDCVTFDDDDAIDVDPDEFWMCAEPEDDEPEDEIECELWPNWLFIEDSSDLLVYASETFPGIALNGVYDGTEEVDREDGRSSGFTGEIADTPAGPFGSPEYPLPAPYVFDPPYNPATKKIGSLCVKVKNADMTDTDGKPMEEVVEICKEPIELLEVSVTCDEDTEETDYTYMVRTYDTVTGRPKKPFAIPGALLSAEKELAKVMSAHGVLMSAKAEMKMSLYLKKQIERMRAERKDREVVTRCGWRSNDHEFVLGTMRFNSEGKMSATRLSPDAEKVLQGYGEVGGTLEAESALLELYGKKSRLPARAVISMMLGSAIAKFSGKRHGAVYSFSDATGTGKSTVHNIGLGFFGNPATAQMNGDSTAASLGIALAARCDLPLYVDDLQVPTTGGKVQHKPAEIRQWILGLTQEKEKSRASQNGKTITTGRGSWHTPVFVSSNVIPDVFLNDECSSLEATYARIMVIPFNTMRGEVSIQNGDRIDDLTPETASKTNFGFIGRAFLAYAMRNQPKIRSDIMVEYDRLQLRAAKLGQDNHTRFHNATLACAFVALRWMAANGLCKSWDIEDTIACMEEYAYTAAEDIKGLVTSDPASMMNEFRTDYGPNMVVCPTVGGLPIVIPDMERHKKIVIRVEGDTAFLNLDVFRSFCAKRGQDYKQTIAGLAAEYGSCAVTHNKVAFSRGIMNTPRQTAKAVRLPAAAILDMKEEADSNVVRMPARQ